ncbi:hypothetical protein IE53DRAFT_379102, partial [Violaceomyces palustris]
VVCKLICLAAALGVAVIVGIGYGIKQLLSQGKSSGTGQGHERRRREEEEEEEGEDGDEEVLVDPIREVYGIKWLAKRKDNGFSRYSVSTVSATGRWPSADDLEIAARAGEVGCRGG